MLGWYPGWAGRVAGATALLTTVAGLGAMAGPAAAQTLVAAPRQRAVVAQSLAAAASTDPTLPYAMTGSTGGGAGPMAAAVDDATHRLYVSDYGTQQDANNDVDIIDTDNLVHVGAYSTSASSHGYGVGVDPLDNRVFSSDLDDHSVAVHDGTTGATIGTIPLSGAPTAVAVDGQSGDVWVASHNNIVTVIDGSTDQVITSIGVGTDPVKIALDPANGNAFVLDNGSSQVTVIDMHSLQVTQTLSTGLFPGGIAVDDPADELFVGAGNSVQVLNLQTFATESTITLPMQTNASFSVQALAIDPGTYYLLVGENTPDSVTAVVDLTDDQTVEQFPYASTSIIVDPATHAVYSTDPGGTVRVFNLPGATFSSLAAAPGSTVPAGTPVTYTDTVSPAPGTTQDVAGTVTFTDADNQTLPGCSDVPLTEGVATCQASYADPGSYPVTAALSGSGRSRDSTDSLTEVVTAAAPPTLPEGPPAGLLAAGLAASAITLGLVARRRRRHPAGS